MASLVVRRMCASRGISSPLSQQVAKFQSYTAAVSHVTMPFKPGVHANDYFAASEKIGAEIKALPGYAPKGFGSAAAVSSLPQLMSGLNVWESLDAAEAVLPKAGPILAKIADYLDTSGAIASRKMYEADLLDYEVLKPASDLQTVFMSATEIQMKPGAAKPLFRDMVAKYDLDAKTKELGLPLAFQIMVYPNDTSVLVYSMTKDMNAFSSFYADPDKQQAMAAWYKETGMVDAMTGPPMGRTMFPEAKVFYF